jgi:hypothetical protein
VTLISVVTGEVTTVSLSLPLTNALPTDAVIEVVFPVTFSDATMTGVAITSGMDGGVSVTQSPAAASTVFDNTWKTSGGPWTVTITRDDTGSVVAKGDTVVLELTDVKNRQWEGGSGEFPLVQTLLADGTTRIDLADASVGVQPPEEVSRLR